METTETLYLSGRMTDQPGFNFAQFDSAERVLTEQYGYKVISPAQHDRQVVANGFAAGRIPYRRPEDVPGYDKGNVVEYQQHAGSVHDLLAWDFLQIIQESDSIAMLPGWEHSSGARAERFVAEAVGKHVYILTEHDYLDGPTAWAIASDIQQRRLHDHVSLFAASVSAPKAPVYSWESCGACRNEEEHFRLTGPPQPTVRPELERAEGYVEDALADLRQLPWPTVPIDTFAHGGHLTDQPSTTQNEVRVVDPKTGGAKGAKAQAMHLVPGDALLAISEHLNKGAQKYAERNWEKGYAWSLSFAAMQRHLWAWWQGEDQDAEFGWSHLRAVGFHALVLLAFELRGVGTDDRPNTGCGPCCGQGNHTPEQPAEKARWEASDER